MLMMVVSGDEGDGGWCKYEMVMVEWMLMVILETEVVNWMKVVGNDGDGDGGENDNESGSWNLSYW